MTCLCAQKGSNNSLYFFTFAFKIMEKKVFGISEKNLARIAHIYFFSSFFVFL